MSFKWSIPSLMVARQDYDADAIALINAAEITTPYIKSAINNLIVKAKAHGWWDLHHAIYGFAGDNILQTYESQYKYNWKDPRDLDAAFRLTFVNSPTCAATGVDWNGSNQYANTHLNASSVLDPNDLAVSYYSRESQETSGEEVIAAYASGTQSIALIIRRTGDVYFSILCDEVGSFVNGNTNTDGKGFYIGSRISSTNNVFYKNGSSVNSNTSANGGTSPNLELFLGCLNFNGSPVSYTDKECAFAGISDGITANIAAQMYLDIQQYQTALGRQV